MPVQAGPPASAPDPSTVARPYRPDDETALLALLEREGEEWSDYWRGAGRTAFLRALASSEVYVVGPREEVMGYLRCRDDDGFGVYVYDLLVDRARRGRGYGRALLERIHQDHPGADVYVMSDADPYYEKLGYDRAGSVFAVPAP